ncbi:hypothetical protein ABH899_004629 [Paenibacillus sp. RC84]
MKKTVRHASLALLVLSSSVFTACTPAAKPHEAAQPGQGSAQGPVDAKEVEAFADPVFAEKMKKYNVNGSSFVVVKDGKVVLSKGYGYADKEKNIPVDKDTVFQIGSVTKTFTALAALQLVDEGKMELRGDIEPYLDGLKVPNKTGTPLTLFDLLTYTSGVDYPDITTYVGPEFVDRDIPTKPFLAEHMPTVVRKPGEAYTYDNFGFLLAGYAVQNVSGLRYDKYMQEKVFKPLGMNSTSVRFTPELLSAVSSSPHEAPGARYLVSHNSAHSLFSRRWRCLTPSLLNVRRPAFCRLPTSFDFQAPPYIFFVCRYFYHITALLRNHRTRDGICSPSPAGISFQKRKTSTSVLSGNGGLLRQMKLVYPKTNGFRPYPLQPLSSTDSTVQYRTGNSLSVQTSGLLSPQFSR